MLNQLSPETIELLKDKPVSRPALNMLRRMNPRRQVEAAEFMVSSGNFSRSFAQALLLATKSDDRVTWRHKPVRGLLQEQKSRMQHELDCVLKESGARDGYGADVLSLVVASGYVSRLIENKAIEDYLSRSHPDILKEFRAIAAATSLDDVSRK
jgi:hypothetical protein